MLNSLGINEDEIDRVTEGYLGRISPFESVPKDIGGCFFLFCTVEEVRTAVKIAGIKHMDDGNVFGIGIKNAVLVEIEDHLHLPGPADAYRQGKTIVATLEGGGGFYFAVAAIGKQDRVGRMEKDLVLGGSAGDVAIGNGAPVAGQLAGSTRSGGIERYGKGQALEARLFEIDFGDEAVGGIGKQSAVELAVPSAFDRVGII